MGGAVPMEGGCNCGEVRYRITAAPFTCYICHCHLCQKRTGSPFSMTLVLPAGSLEFTKGQPERSERALPNGGGVNVAFSCGACMSRIHTERAGHVALGLRAGTLDDTGWVRPVAQFWISSAQPWAIVPDILTYEEQPADPTPMLEAWKAAFPS